MNGWRTTPSFGPVSQFDQLQFVGPDHPGRQAFVAAHPNLTDTAGNPLDPTSPEPWYFFGRLVGNTGPARFLTGRAPPGGSPPRSAANWETRSCTTTSEPCIRGPPGM